MIEKITKVIEALNKNAVELDNKLVTIGFDGFLDSVVHVVKEKESVDNLKYFGNIEEFGNYLISKKGVSGCIELIEQQTKMGGNMPIMSNALGHVGVKVNCIGAFGMLAVKEEFKSLENSNCTIYSVAEPGNTLALEFDDGKIMLAKMPELDKLAWDDIKKIVGIDKLIELYSESDLIGAVNWSELENSNLIWEGILKDVVSGYKPEKKQFMFFDLSDCSKKSKEAIKTALNIIKEFSSYYRVILGMNENEARLIFNSISDSVDMLDLAEMGEVIYNTLGIDEVVIHPISYSMAWNESGSYRIDNLFIDKPRFSTGGGDNFNAGYCSARLLGFELDAAMIIGNALSGFYIKNGFSAKIPELIEFLNEWKLEITQKINIIA